jgi:hypothetical protein
MRTLSFATIAPISGYHAVMVNTGFFAQPEPVVAPKLSDAEPMSAAAALIERDHALAALVARMARKDEAALSTLFDMTAKRLHSFALRIVGDVGLGVASK